MSTPAQINRRPIKQPRSIRDRHRSTTPVGSSTNIAQQQSMVFQPPNQAFTFGDNSSTTASFPPSSGPQFSGFGAGSTTGAASFTFGQSQPSTFNNPFTASNSVGSAQDNAMMDSSPQKSATSMFSFGAPAAQSQSATTNGFTGTQSQSQLSQGSLFGSAFGQSNTNTQQGSTSTANIFGGASQSQTKDNTAATNSTNMFSQSVNNNPFSFGKPAAQTPSTPTSLFAGFGQAQQPPATAPPPATKFMFGQTNVTNQPEQSSSKPANLFGNSTSASNPATSGPSTTSLFNFGSTSTPKTQEEERPTSQQSSSSFGTFGSFAGFGNKPADSHESAPPAGGLFGRVSAADTPAQSIEPADEPDQTPKPFAGFNFKPTSESEDNASKKPLFSFGTPGGNKDPEPSRSPSPTKSDSMPPQFKFTAPSTSTISSGGIFSIVPAPSTIPSNLFAHLSTPTSSGTPPVSSLFGAPRSTSTEDTHKVGTQDSGAPMTAPATPSNIFSTGGLAQPPHNSTPFSGFGQQAPSAPQDTQPATKSLANMFSAGSATQSSNAPLSRDSLSNGESPSKKQVLDTSSSATTSATTPKSLFGNTFTPAKTAEIDTSAQLNGPARPVQPKLPQLSSSLSTTVERAVSTEGPPQIPRNLNASKYRSYDESWRLRALGKCFQQQMAKLDTARMDPMNLIQNYLDHREAIGEGAGRYGRSKAGMKRKTDDVDDMQEKDVANKRAPNVASASANTTKPTPTISFGSSATSNTSKPPPAAPTLFSGFGQSSTTPKSSPAKSVPVNPLANISSSKSGSQASAGDHEPDRTSSLFKAMIPGASDSAGPAKPSFGAPTTTGFKPAGFVPAVPKAAGFTPNLTSANGGATNFLSAFASSAAKEKEKIKAKRKAEEYDSDDSDADPDAWDSQYEAEQQAKRAKIESIAHKGIGFSFTPTGSVSPSRGNSPFAFGVASAVNGVTSEQEVSDEDKENAIEGGDDTEEQEESGDAGDDEAEELEEVEEQPNEEVEEEEEQGAEAENAEDYTLQPGETSLFSRISGGGKDLAATTGSETPVLQAPANNSFGPSTIFSNIGQSTPEQPTFSPFTPSTNRSPFKPAKAFTFTPQQSAAPKDGASIFSGATLKAGPIPGEGLFGSRPGTPSNDAEKADKPALFSSFKSTTHEGEDHTWKPSTPIKFGSSEPTAPAVQVQESTPPPKNPFAGLFSSSSTASSTTNGASSLGFTFGQTSSTSAPAPSLLGVAPHLASTSRASSPGVPTDTESIATDLSEDAQDDPQTQLLTSGAKLSGEEDEDALYESRAAGMRYVDHKDPETRAMSKKWIKYGSGVLKILKHKETGKTRILFRAEPGANVLLNVSANANIRYTAEKIGSNGALKFMVIEDVKGEKKVTPWMLRVKTPAMSEQMAEIMEREKTV